MVVSGTSKPFPEKQAVVRTDLPSISSIQQPDRRGCAHSESSSLLRSVHVSPTSVVTEVPKLNPRISPLRARFAAAGSLMMPCTRSDPSRPSHEDKTLPTGGCERSCSTCKAVPPFRPRLAELISARDKSAAWLRLPSLRGGGCATPLNVVLGIAVLFIVKYHVDICVSVAQEQR